MSLNGITPAETCGVKIEYEDNMFADDIEVKIPEGGSKRDKSHYDGYVYQLA
jgi:hypothetical protein